MLCLNLQNKAQCDGNRNNKSIQPGELPRKSLDFLKNAKCIYEHHQHEVPMVFFLALQKYKKYTN